MNSNIQNEKIELLTDEWLIVGIDVGSEKHFARMFNNRKIELSRKALGFENDEKGFALLNGWISNQLRTSGMKYVMCAMEPTGHYWYNLAGYLQTQGMVVVHVNPSHVKKSKEFDDNNPSKNDRKDPKTIAGLVTEGRYMFPYMPEGIYASIMDLNNMRMRATESLVIVKNRLARWFSIYFPEFTSVFGDLKAKSARLLLAETPLPEDVVKLGAEGVNQIFRNAKLRAVGMKKAPHTHPASLRSMQEVLGDMMGGFPVPGPDPGQPTLYVATMESMNRGAGVLAYPGFLDEAAEKLGGSFFILPSSIHELLFLQDNGTMDRHELTAMVRSINAAEVSPEDQLSDNVYHYDGKDRVFELAEKYDARKAERQKNKYTAEISVYFSSAR